MAEVVYILCALTSLFCATLLVRQHRRRPTSLLLWSSACFVGLAANSAFLVVDLMVVPELDLSIPRTLVALVAMSAMVFGLLWETK